MNSEKRKFYEERTLDSKSTWFDLEEFFEEEEDDQRRLQYRNTARGAAAEARIKQNLAEELQTKWLKFDAYRRRGFTEASSRLFSFGDEMPAKRKFTGQVSTRDPKVKRAAKVYNNATGQKMGNNKYGHSASSETAMLKALVAAESQRQISKSIETQHSYCLVTMNSHRNTGAMSGFSMVGLNQVVTPPTSTSPMLLTPMWNNMMMFNLSALCQVRDGSSPTVNGYRVGNRVNVQSVNVTINGGVHAPSTDCTYRAMIARRRDGALVGSATTPQLVQSNQSSLWKTADEGPYALKNTGFSVYCPVPNYCSMMRRNYDSWSFPNGASCAADINIQSAGPGSATEDSDYTAKLNMNLYHSFTEVWDYPSAASTGTLTIKGGDYFFYLWREGPEDSMAQTSINVQFSLSFKDG